MDNEVIQPPACEVGGVADGPAYDLTFFLCYAANTAVMVAVSVLFRYADFVRFLGGAEMQLGLIVGVGTIGALLMRLVQGVATDRYGPRRVWLLSLMIFIAAMLLHLGIERVDGIGIYVVRILFMVSVAGAFGASLTYVSLRVPENRMGEMIGMLGSSGFIGLALGPTIGDLLFSGPEVTRVQIQAMFLVAAAMGFVSLLCAAVATRGSVRQVQRRAPSVVALIRRYHPGPLLLIAATMGIGLSLPHVFLKAYAAELSIPRIKIFFIVYAVTAFVVRIATRRFIDRVGVRPAVLVGFASLSVSMLLYLVVRGEVSFSVPAVFAGTAHAFLFPAVLAGGSMSFPIRYRGLATTLMLTMFDVGNLVGQPAVGGVVQVGRQLGWPAYPVMFVGMAATISSVALLYAWQTRGGQITAGQRPGVVSFPPSPPPSLQPTEPAVELEMGGAGGPVSTVEATRADAC